MNKKQWKTIATLKTPGTRVAADLNQKGPYLQVKFGRLSFEQGIDQDPIEMTGSPFIPLPNQSSDVEAWASEMHVMIDSIAQKAKEFLENDEKRADRPEATRLRRAKRDRSGLRALARRDAEKSGAVQDLEKKEEERKRKPKRSKQERAERDREIRAKMKKG